MDMSATLKIKVNRSNFVPINITIHMAKTMLVISAMMKDGMASANDGHMRSLMSLLMFLPESE